jgi:hypothetical protein
LVMDDGHKNKSLLASARCAILNAENFRRDPDARTSETELREVA